VVNDRVVRYILLSSKRAFSRGGEYPGESFAPTLMSVPIMTASTDAVPLLHASSWDFCFLPMRMVWALRVKAQVSVSRSGRRRRLSPPSCGRRLGESALAVVRGFSCVVVDGRRGSGPGLWMCVEAAASRSSAGRCFMGWSSCSLGLGDSLVSPVRRGCRLG
jgi:hypothetical protein